MKPEPNLFEDVDDEAEAAADAEALADIEAGRVVPHEEVARWLDTWGTPDEAPPPASWFRSSGLFGRWPIWPRSRDTSTSFGRWRRSAWHNG